MFNFRLLFALCILFILAGCAGVGIVASSDPAIKLHDAGYLFRFSDRPLPAERLIFEAIAIYQERKDSLGLGMAYQTYAELLRSPSIVGTEGKAYREYGFQDKTVTLENRIAKSIEYFDKARELFEKAKAYDRVSYLDLDMAWSYALHKDRETGCKLLESSLENNVQFERSNPGSTIRLPKDVKTFSEFIANNKNKMHCSGGYLSSAATKNIVLIIQGADDVINSKDWGQFRKEWRTAMETAALNSGIGYAYKETENLSPTDTATLIVVKVNDYRYISSFKFFSLQLKAFVDADVSYFELPSRRPVGTKIFKISSPRDKNDKTGEQIENINKRIIEDIVQQTTDFDWMVCSACSK